MFDELDILKLILFATWIWLFPACVYVCIKKKLPFLVRIRDLAGFSEELPKSLWAFPLKISKTSFKQFSPLDHVQIVSAPCTT